MPSIVLRDSETLGGGKLSIGKFEIQLLPSKTGEDGKGDCRVVHEKIGHKNFLRLAFMKDIFI